MLVEPMEITGTSANITFYAERSRQPGYLWAEVLRDDYRRRVPVFSFTVRRDPNIPVTTFRYHPAGKPRSQRLSPSTVARQIRDHVARLS